MRRSRCSGGDASTSRREKAFGEVLAPLLAAAVLAGAAACGGEPPEAVPEPEPEPAASPAMLDVFFEGTRITAEIDTVMRGANLRPDDNIRTWPLGSDERTSHFLAGIRDGEIPHSHLEHDLFVMVLRGEGTMEMGGEEEKLLGEGSIAYIPRGVPHAFRNKSELPSMVYVIYSPPTDGTDWVPVDPDATLAGDGEPPDAPESSSAGVE